jgi:tagatose 6-phosphate kinase
VTQPILAVALNAALDITYYLDEIAWHGTNRPAQVIERAGGKGINVAHVLRELGAQPVVLGFVGGVTGGMIRGELAGAGIDDRLIETAGESRRTVAVVERAHGDATLFVEPGPRISDQEWDRLLAAYGRALPGVGAVTISGGIPPGVPSGAYARLLTLAAEAGVPSVLDSESAALRRGLGGRPTVAKPNRVELEELLGRPLPAIGDLLDAARELRDQGAESVVVSMGAEGMLAVTPQGTWKVVPPEKLSGNPTGAGDAAAAALALSLAERTPWPGRLVEAAALSMAAVRAPVAGTFDEAAYANYRERLRAEPLP